MSGVLPDTVKIPVNGYFISTTYSQERNMNRAKISAVIFCVCVCFCGLCSAEPTSENNANLRKALERYPEADANGDGVLTLSEAKAFKQKQRSKQRSAKGAKADQADKKRPAPTFADVKYGPHERNVLDFWQAKSAKPTPVVVFIHGGGFKAGDKSKISPYIIQKCLQNGVSVAAINYRFLKHAPLQDILRDAARAIQFLRHKSGQWNIDKKRFASFGGSAGAGTSLWLAFHDDLADPDNEDPVLRESSRLAVIGANGCQCTYDLQRWAEIIGQYPGEQDESEICQFYGLKNPDELDSPKGKRIRADVDMLGLLTRDDPPVFLQSSQPNTEPTNRGHYVHHPRHAIAIRKKCDQLGIETVLILKKAPPPPGKSANDVMLEFFFKHLKIKS